jgi:iron complex transport system ATP-binding protein
MRTENSLKLRTDFRVTKNTLVIDLHRSVRVLSSAPKGGGVRSARYILNHQVKVRAGSDSRRATAAKGRHPECGDPARYLRRQATIVGVDDNCVALMTAVPMNQLVVHHEESHGVWVECFATVGITNAVRAGEWQVVESHPKRGTDLGTINLILVTNAALSTAAMVGAVQVATESKAGILRDHAIPSWTGVPGATGTGTDAVVVACELRGKGARVSYSGTHTSIGAMIGRVVAACVTQGLARAAQWSARATRHARSASTEKSGDTRSQTNDNIDFQDWL